MRKNLLWIGVVVVALAWAVSVGAQETQIPAKVMGVLLEEKTDLHFNEIHVLPCPAIGITWTRKNRGAAGAVFLTREFSFDEIKEGKAHVGNILLGVSWQEAHNRGEVSWFNVELIKKITSDDAEEIDQ